MILMHYIAPTLGPKLHDTGGHEFKNLGRRPRGHHNRVFIFPHLYGSKDFLISNTFSLYG